jgi:hypothetical protein
MTTINIADPKISIPLQFRLFFHDMRFNHAQSLIALVGVVSMFANSTICNNSRNEITIDGVRKCDFRSFPWRNKNVHSVDEEAFMDLPVDVGNCPTLFDSFRGATTREELIEASQ